MNGISVERSIELETHSDVGGEIRRSRLLLRHNNRVYHRVERREEKMQKNRKPRQFLNGVVGGIEYRSNGVSRWKSTLVYRRRGKVVGEGSTFERIDGLGGSLKGGQTELLRSTFLVQY